MENNRERVYSVTMTENELRLFSEFLEEMKQREYSMLRGVSSVLNKPRKFNLAGSTVKTIKAVAAKG